MAKSVEYCQDLLMIRVENGESIPSIAQSLGVSRSGLCDFLRSHPNYKKAKKTTKIGINSIARIIELYQLNWAMPEIAKEFGVCVQTINSILTKNQVVKRPRGRSSDSLSKSIIGYSTRSYWR